MELIKRNIHMDRVKRSTVIQFTMEEDLNLPEDKPDISTLNLEKGEVVIEEIRPGTDEVPFCIIRRRQGAIWCF